MTAHPLLLGLQKSRMSSRPSLFALGKVPPEQSSTTVGVVKRCGRALIHGRSLCQRAWKTGHPQLSASPKGVPDCSSTTFPFVKMSDEHSSTAVRFTKSSSRAVFHGFWLREKVRTTAHPGFFRAQLSHSHRAAGAVSRLVVRYLPTFRTHPTP